MKKVFEDHIRTVYITETGTRIIIEKCENTIEYFHVFVISAADKKYKKIATRCRYEKAVAIATDYEGSEKQK